MAEAQYPDSMKVDEYLETLRGGRAEYEKIWSGLSPDQMTRRPGPQHDWSIKDLIGHLCWWETFTISRVMLMRAGLPLPRIEDFDALNAQVFNAWRDLPLDFVLAEWDSNLTRIESYGKTLSDDAFNEPDPVDGRTPFRLLGGNTVGHYLEHEPDLVAYIEALKP